MSDFLTLMAWFGTSIGSIFTILDSVYFMDTGLTLLDIYLSLMILDLILWFVSRIIGSKWEELGESARERAYTTPESRDEERLSELDEY